MVGSREILIGLLIWSSAGTAVATAQAGTFYKFPKDPDSGSTVTLELVGKPLADRPGSGDRVTDGAISTDGKWVVLRTKVALTYCRGEDFMRGDFRETHRQETTRNVGGAVMHAVVLRVLVTAALAIGVTTASCSRAIRKVELTPDAPAKVAELWQDPGNIAACDVFHGPGGKDLMPAHTDFEFVAEDKSGFSPGFDVRDGKGMEWSVKTGPEAQTEVVASRVLWAIGFHQPPTYYVQEWSLTGGRTGTQQPGRFRPDLKTRTVVGEWPWHQNPFVGSPEFGGLIVANLVINSWDWKRSNNKIYQLDAPVNGVSRWFVVRDLGASFGKFTYPTILKWLRLRGFGQGSRNDLPGFEEQPFIKAIDADRSEVDFHYRGIYRDVISSVEPSHVRWACERLSQLTDAQWRDIFRAGGYSAEDGARFTAKIKEKIAQGLQLTAAN